MTEFEEQVIDLLKSIDERLDTLESKISSIDSNTDYIYDIKNMIDS